MRHLFPFSSKTNFKPAPKIMLFLTAFSSLLSLATTQPTANDREYEFPCAEVHMMLARGTTENYPGLLGTLTNKILDAIPGSDYENIIYPATQEGSTPSYGEGIRNGTAQLKRYASVCPNSKIVLFGYSQVWHISIDFWRSFGTDIWLGIGRNGGWWYVGWWWR